MRLIYTTIIVISLFGGLAAIKGVSILNHSDERMNRAGFISSQTVAHFKPAKGCE